MLGVGTLETCFMGANAPPPVLQGCGGTVSEMTYSVSSGTINPSIPYHTDAPPPVLQRCGGPYKHASSLGGHAEFDSC